MNDTAATWFNYHDNPMYQGGFDWIINNDWTIPGSGIIKTLGPQTHHSELIDAAGDFSVSKWGQKVTRSLNDTYE